MRKKILITFLFLGFFILAKTDVFAGWFGNFKLPSIQTNVQVPDIPQYFQNKVNNMEDQIQFGIEDKINDTIQNQTDKVENSIMNPVNSVIGNVGDKAKSLIDNITSLENLNKILNGKLLDSSLSSQEKENIWKQIDDNTKKIQENKTSLNKLTNGGDAGVETGDITYTKDASGNTAQGLLANENKPTLGQIISAALPYVYIIAGLCLLILLIWGGITLMTAGGNPDKAKQGYGILSGALIGFLIIFISYFVVQLVQVMLGVKIL